MPDMNNLGVTIAPSQHKNLQLGDSWPPRFNHASLTPISACKLIYFSVPNQT